MARREATMRKPLEPVSDNGVAARSHGITLYSLDWCEVTPEKARQDALARGLAGEQIDRKGVASNLSWMMWDILFEAHPRRRERLYAQMRDCRADLRKILRELDVTSAGRAPMTICFTKDKGGIHTETASGTQVVWGEKSDIIVMSLHGEHLSGSERDSRAVWYGRLKSARSSFLEVDVKSHAQPLRSRNAGRHGPMQLPMMQAMMHFTSAFFDEAETYKVEIRFYHLAYLGTA